MQLIQKTWNERKAQITSCPFKASEVLSAKSEQQDSKALFTWKEDDPSARMILALGSSERDMFSAFSLHANRMILSER